MKKIIRINENPLKLTIANLTNKKPIIKSPYDKTKCIFDGPYEKKGDNE